MNSSIRFMKKEEVIFAFFVNKSSTHLSLEIIIQRASKLHNDMFVNKLVNMRLNLTKHNIILLYVYLFKNIFI